MTDVKGLVMAVQVWIGGVYGNLMKARMSLV